MEKEVNSIVEKVINSPKLGELTPLKGHGIWKDQLKVVLKLAYSAANFAVGNAVSGTIGVAECFDDEIEIYQNYKLSEFFRKFTYFALELADVSTEERLKFSEELQEKIDDYSGNIIMGMVDRMDIIHKEKVLANLVKARIHDFISVDDFFRLCSMLERIPFVDLEHLNKYSDHYYDESGDSELLFATGALKLSLIDDEKGNKYVLSQMGEKMLKFGMQDFNTKIKQIKGTSLPFKFSDSDEEEYPDVEAVFDE